MVTIRHRPVADRVKAAALFDDDRSGNSARVSLGKEIDRMGLGKYGLKPFRLAVPPRLRDLKKVALMS